MKVGFPNTSQVFSIESWAPKGYFPKPIIHIIQSPFPSSRRRLVVWPNWCKFAGHGEYQVDLSPEAVMDRCMWEGKVDRVNKWKKLFQIGFQNKGSLKSVCKTQLWSHNMRESGKTRSSTPIDRGSHGSLGWETQLGFLCFPQRQITHISLQLWGSEWRHALSHLLPGLSGGWQPPWILALFWAEGSFPQSFFPPLRFLPGQGLRADHGAERCKI